MHPIERLRYVARAAGVDATEMAAEAADALGALAFEPRALVLACRRLLDAQPDNAPLWWVAAHVLAAADPAAVARSCAERLAVDVSGLELAYGVPSGSVVAAEASCPAPEALAERPDCSLRLFGTPFELRYALAGVSAGVAGGPDAVGYGPDELDEGLEGATIVVVGARAASPSQVLVGTTGALLAANAASHGAELWVAAGEGRVLPAALFERCSAGAPPEELVGAGRFDRAATTGGLVDPRAGLDPGDCPVPASLATAPGRR